MFFKYFVQPWFLKYRLYLPDYSNTDTKELAMTIVRSAFIYNSAQLSLLKSKTFRSIIILSCRVAVTLTMHFAKKLISLIMNYPINAAILATFLFRKTIVQKKSLPSKILYIFTCT